MCFSNLPIEFDEEGNPYLAEEADEVDRAAACDCGEAAEEVALDDADPEAVFASIVESLPGDVREQVGGADAPRDTEDRDRPVVRQSD